LRELCLAGFEDSLANQWIVTPRTNRTAQVRLLCVPHAGGGVASFRGWSERLRAEVGIVQLPGRGSRLREPLVTTIPDAAAGIVTALASLPVYPTVLFGHSLGALIAFETARRLRDSGWPLLALFVSGRRAPGLPEPLPPISGLPAHEFVTEVQRRYDAVPAAVASDAELMELLVPGLRADFAMLEGYRNEAAAPLTCPIIACGGATDPHASRAELEAWKRETSNRFSVHLFSGGHFYLQQEHEALTALIANQLSVMVAALTRWAAIR
jgi:medium-chain acyl-[acyl-carrier-protein] hydrolase